LIPLREITMIHHVSVGTNDIERAKAFYDPLMALIGFRLLKASDGAVHYGASDIVFSVETPVDGRLPRRATVFTSHFRRRTGKRSEGSLRLPWRTAAPTKERPASARTTTQTITPPSSGIPMATRSRPSPIRQGKALD
jgi:catechol 2,3-dioxygenase-like lactoylglutathione lyase family enzyme